MVIRGGNSMTIVFAIAFRVVSELRWVAIRVSEELERGEVKSWRNKF